jgi:hypothetical protein
MSLAYTTEPVVLPAYLWTCRPPDRYRTWYVAWIRQGDAWELQAARERLKRTRKGLHAFALAAEIMGDAFEEAGNAFARFAEEGGGS